MQYINPSSGWQHHVSGESNVTGEEDSGLWLDVKTSSSAVMFGFMVENK